MDKNMRQAKAERARRDEENLNHILCWMGGGVLLEFLLLLLNRYYINYTVGEIDLGLALQPVVKVLAVAGLAGAGACALLWYRSWRAGKPWVRFEIAALFLAGVSAGCFAAWLFQSSGLKLMYTAVPVVVLLAVIYYLYQREFFLQACGAALSLLCIWVAGRGLGGPKSGWVYVCVALSVLALAGGIVMCRQAQGNGGTARWKGKALCTFPKDANYALLYAGAAIYLALMLAAVLGVASVVLYGVTAAWLLIMAVFFTVKLM